MVCFKTSEVSQMPTTREKTDGQARLAPTGAVVLRGNSRNCQIWMMIALVSAGALCFACDDGPAQQGPSCGNGILEEGEACERGQAALWPCTNVGFPAGIAVCGYDCQYDTSFCTDGTCDNLIDDFGRGVDCDDPACLGRMGCRGESCTDGIDNDGDGLSDCLDISDCGGKVPNCKAGCFPTERQHLDGCSDGVDADCDGLVDDEDPECDHPVGFLLAFFPFSGYEYSRYYPGMFPNYKPVHGAWGLISITFLAEHGDLQASELHWPRPEGLTEAYPQDRTFILTRDRTVIWDVENLRRGESVTVHVMVRVSPSELDTSEICMRAWLNTDPPIYTTHPDPSVMRDGLMCVDVWEGTPGHGL